MKPHHRVMLFCLVLLFSPLLYALGGSLAGLPGAVLLPATATLLSFFYAWLGSRREPPLGARPS